MPNWEQLPNDVLQHITSFLPLQDYFRFGAVCHSWLFVAKEKHCSPARQLPWLMLSDNATTKTRDFFSLSEQKVYHVGIPELYGRHFSSSSHGWLVTVDKKLQADLLNPFSGARIQLPILPPYTRSGSRKYDRRLARKWNVNEVMIYKTILSADPSKTSDYIIMAIVGETRRLAFCKSSKMKWIELKGFYPRYEDVIWYKGEFYVVNCCNEVSVVDLGPNPSVKRIDPFMRRHISWEKYLVDLMGDLLFILREIVLVVDDMFRTTSFSVYKLDVSEGKWIRLHGIGDYALFLGMNCSMAVPALEFPGCRKNCIYFTEDFEDPKGDKGIYSMEDGSIESFYPGNSFPEPTSLSIWVNPNPW